MKESNILMEKRAGEDGFSISVQASREKNVRESPFQPHERRRGHTVESLMPTVARLILRANVKVIECGL